MYLADALLGPYPESGGLSSLHAQESLEDDHEVNPDADAERA